MQNESLRPIGEELFARVREAFPMLSMHLEPDPPDATLRMSIPAQPGLAFPVALSLRDDELEIHAGDLELTFVGCTMRMVRRAWFEGVSGLLSGTFRIRETRAGGRTIQSELQRPSAQGWETVIMTSEWGTAPRRKTRRILQNRA